jgi:hypothetical protein
MESGVKLMTIWLTFYFSKHRSEETKTTTEQNRTKPLAA